MTQRILNCCFIVVTAAKMNFISLKIISENSLEYECGILKYLPPPFIFFLPLFYTPTIISQMCHAGWPAEGAVFTRATFNLPFKVSWPFNNQKYFQTTLQNVFISSGWITVDWTFLSHEKNGQKPKSWVAFHMKIIVTFPLSLSQIYCKFPPSLCFYLLTQMSLILTTYFY